MNTISQEQLTIKQLDRLAAASHIYLQAKKILAFQMILSVPLVIIWSIVVAILSKFQVYAAYWGISVTLLDVLIFAPWQQSLKEKAAKIQELFDCDVLQIEWQEATSGSRPDTEEIVRASSYFKRRNKKKNNKYFGLENWYPISVDQLPIDKARIICQRSNCWWDAELRRRYSFWVIVVLILLTLIVFLVGLVGGLTLEKFFLAVLAPLTPAFVLGMREYREHLETAKTLDRLKHNAENLWTRAIRDNLAPPSLRRESRNLQDEIYNHRRKSPLIFNWIYQRLRKEQEEQMNKGAEAMVEDATKNS